MDNLFDFSLQNENEFRNISMLFDEMKVQYNLNNLKNCTIEILNCLEKKDGSVANIRLTFFIYIFYKIPNKSFIK